MLYKWSVFFFYSLFFLFTYFFCNIIIVSILFNNGILDLAISHTLYQPLYMNPQPLDFYPEYKQIDNIQQIFNVKQHLLNIKQDLEIKLLFNKPECYKEIVEGLERLYDNNKLSLQDPSKLHPHVQHQHQSHWMNDLKNQIEYSKKEYITKLENFQQNHRNLAECNQRIIAVSTRITQITGSNT